MSPRRLAEFRRKRDEAKRIHRAKKYGSGGRHSEEQWQQLCAICDHRCVACGKKRKLTRDHIVPLSRGGSDNIENIQPLCRSCNSSKNARHAMDYRTGEQRKMIFELAERLCPVCLVEIDPQYPSRGYCSKRCYGKAYRLRHGAAVQLPVAVF